MEYVRDQCTSYQHLMKKSYGWTYRCVFNVYKCNVVFYRTALTVVDKTCIVMGNVN